MGSISNQIGTKYGANLGLFKVRISSSPKSTEHRSYKYKVPGLPLLVPKCSNLGPIWHHWEWDTMLTGMPENVKCIHYWVYIHMQKLPRIPTHKICEVIKRFWWLYKTHNTLNTLINKPLKQQTEQNIHNQRYEFLFRSTPRPSTSSDNHDTKQWSLDQWPR